MNTNDFFKFNNEILRFNGFKMDKVEIKKYLDNAHLTVRKLLIEEIMAIQNKNARRGLLELACMMNNADLNEAILIHKGGLK